MKRDDFLARLRNALSDLPPKDVEEHLSFYSEMIQDRMEDGDTEEEAVAAVGSVDEIAAQIIADVPLTKIVRERIKPKRRLSGWEILLLTLGSPIWISLGIAAIAVIFSTFVSALSVMISLWAGFVSLVAVALSGFAAGILFICQDHSLSGIAVIAAGFICAGLSIYMFFGCKALSVGIVKLTKKLVIWVKNCLVRKEDAA